MISKLPAVISTPDSKQKVTSVLKLARRSGAPAFITKKGCQDAVLIDTESFRRPESAREILAALARGEQEIAEGIGYDLDEILTEADQLLARDIP